MMLAVMKWHAIILSLRDKWTHSLLGTMFWPNPLAAAVAGTVNDLVDCLRRARHSEMDIGFVIIHFNGWWAERSRLKAERKSARVGVPDR